MRKYIIALYIRLSLEDYKYESLSIENQRLVLTAHTEALPEAVNAEILEFVDNGYSGANFERPAVQELLELVRQNKVDCIIVKDFSRFGRNSLETGYFIEQVFPLFRTRFISVSDDFDTINFKNDTGGMDVAFKYLISEYYSRDLSVKSKSAKYAKMKRGEYQSKICCYGYKKGTDGRLEIDNEAAEVVQLVFDLAAQGMNTTGIVKALYEKGIPTPGEYKAARGNKTHDVSRTKGVWSGSTVLRMLEDERYIGTYIMGKRTVKEVGGTQSRLKDESEWFKIPGHHAAIVDQAVFEQVQSGIRRFKLANKKAHQYPLRGKVYCGNCGHALSRTNKTMYHCRYSQVDASFPCHDLKIRSKELESLLFEIISKQAQVILNIGAIQGVRELNVQLAQKTEFEGRLEQLQDDKQQLYEQYLMSEISLDEYKAVKRDYDVELQEVKQIYSALASRTKQAQLEHDERQKLIGIAKDVSKESELTQALAELLINRVYVFSGNRIEIDWGVQDFAGTAIEKGGVLDDVV